MSNDQNTTGSGEGGSSSPIPGWYPDPYGSAETRWWDGGQWTADTNGAAGLQAPYGSEPNAGVSTATINGAPNTVFVWILAVLPLVSLLSLAFVSFPRSFSEADLAAYQGQNALVTVLGLVVWVVSILIAFADHRELGRRGYPQRFHWAWSILWVAVYMVGRAVVLRRVDRAALTPLWVWIALYALTFVISMAVVFNAIGSLMQTLPTT